MDLWSSVEKTKAARDAQRESMKRSKTRSDPAQGALAQVGSHGRPAAPCGPGNKLKPYSCLVRPRCRAAQRRGTGMLAQALKCWCEYCCLSQCPGQPAGMLLPLYSWLPPAVPQLRLPKVWSLLEDMCGA